MISASGSAYSGNPYRIDHCSFLSTVGSTIFIDNFSARGLIDHNEFYAPDNAEMIHNFGDGVAGWSEDIIPGSPAALYVENNTFTNNNTGPYFYGSSAIQSYDGARVVFRYNFLDFVQVDVHGTPGMIGARWFEIYENTFNIPSRALGGGQDKYMGLRAGSGVVFNNHKTGISSNASIVLYEEDSGYPALYQIGRGINQKSSPVYLWGNDSTMSIVSGSSNVVAGRDFYVSASQPATMQLQETSSDNSSTSYTYIAFTYPYPLDANAYPYPLAGNADPNPPDANALVAPTLTLHTDSGTTGDGITNVGRVDVSGLASGATWQYSTDGGAHWINGNGTSFTLSGDGLKNVIARQTDAAGNTSGNSLTLSFILDTTAPAAPTLALHTDSGTPGDGITNVGRVDVSGLASGATWQYSTDGGAHWINGSGTSFTLSGDGLKNVIARQTDAAGNTSGNSLALSFTLGATTPVSGGGTTPVSGGGTTTTSLFSASNTPAGTNYNDGRPLEVGVKFQSSVAGQITALKFYRSPSDTGADLLDLWTATGTKLASATFTNTAASGWQTVALSTPVAIAANTTYVVSYHTTGAYAATDNFFTTDVTSGVLTAPSISGNGVYAYGGTSTAGIFPTNTWYASNYWADVVFAGGGTTPVSGGGTTPVSGGGTTTTSLFSASNTPAGTNYNDGRPLEVGVKFQSSVAGQITALKFYRSPSDTGADLLDLWTATGTKLASATFTNTAASGWQTVALSTPVAIAANTTYVVSYHTTGAYAATDNFFTTDVTSGVLTAPSISGNGVYAYGGTSTAGIFPTNTWYASNYWADVVFAGGGTTPVSGGGTTPVSGGGTTPVSGGGTTTTSLFSASNTPAGTNYNDGRPLEVGVKFQSSVAGQITALKFYRSPSDTGADLLDLWTATGTKLASATFTNTAASGWQTVALSTPVAIAANTTYVVSYHTTGAYAATDNFFTTDVTSGVLTAPSISGNGVYAYGGTSTAGIFPTNTWYASNYWADVVFTGNIAPAGVAGEAINLGLTNPTDYPGSIVVNISGVPSGWTMSAGTDNGDGTWTVQTSDIGALSVISPESYAGALVLNVSESWINADGSSGNAFVADNVEVYGKGTPIFAISGGDNLSGSSADDLFVLAQPIGNDTIRSFDVTHDKVDLIAFCGLSSFVDIGTRLSENSNGDAVVAIAEGESIIFEGVSAKSVTANNFLFNRDTVMDNADSIVIADNAVLPLAGNVNNSGAIELTSIGGQTRLQVLANGLTLEGAGYVDLSDSNGNIIVGTTPVATLTNVDNTISGAGQLGGGRLRLHNEGTIIASGGNALTVDTGANVVVNAGTLKATGTGGLVVHNDLANSGLLWANGGDITIDGNVSGTGAALIDGLATFEMGGAFGENITLDAGASATLRIDHAADFSGTVAASMLMMRSTSWMLLSAAIPHLIMRPTAATQAEL